MSEIYEEDVLDAGKNQVIIGNDNTKVIIVPELGGRIADIQAGDTKFLYRTYPEGVNFGPYTEYGGIEECIGGAPGTLWNTDWKWEQQNGGVLLQARSKSVLVKKLISLDDTEPIVKIYYRFYSFGVTFSKFTFGVHPEVSIGGELKDNKYHVPTGGEVLNGGYPEPGFKSKIPPSEGWCAVTYDDKVVGQMFPEGVIDVIQLYYPKVNTHMILGPIIFGVGMSPGMCAEFTYMVYTGDGDVDKVKEIRAAREAELTTKYEPFEEADIPDELMSELEERAGQPQQDAGVRPGPDFHPGVKIPQIPKVDIPDVGAIIQNALKGIKGVKVPNMPKIPKPNINVDAVVTPAPKPDDFRTEDLPPETEITIEHLKGDVAVHVWDLPYVDYSEVKGEVSVGQGDGATHVKVEASGDYSLRVPRDVARISLNFVNGNVSMFGITSSLKISGVKGDASIVATNVPEGADLDVSLVRGDIDMSIPADSSSNIFAASLSGGEISCELPLQEEEQTRNQISGVLGDGKARISLNTVRGNISIGQVKNEGGDTAIINVDSESIEVRVEGSDADQASDKNETTGEGEIAKAAEAPEATENSEVKDDE